jgi:hypothetical protein
MTRLGHYAMTVPSRHPDMLLVRIPVFAKNGTDVRSPSVPILPYFHLALQTSRHFPTDLCFTRNLDTLRRNIINISLNKAIFLVPAVWRFREP